MCCFLKTLYSGVSPLSDQGIIGRWSWSLRFLIFCIILGGVEVEIIECVGSLPKGGGSRSNSFIRRLEHSHWPQQISFLIILTSNVTKNAPHLAQQND